MNPTNHRRTGRLALTLGFFACAWPMAATSQGVNGIVPPTPAERDSLERPVSFSLEQAERGKQRYAKDCEECHGKDLKGGMNGGAPIRGLAFEQKYADTQASVMFQFMTDAMPPNAPGRYSPSTYADLMAYILERNGFRPGAPLPDDLDALDNLIIEK